MTNKGMGDKDVRRSGQTGDKDKSDEGAFGDKGHSTKDNQTGSTGQPGQSQGMDTLTSHPSKKGNKG